MAPESVCGLMVAYRPLCTQTPPERNLVASHVHGLVDLEAKQRSHFRCHNVYGLFSSIQMEARDRAMARAKGLAELLPAGPSS